MPSSIAGPLRSPLRGRSAASPGARFSYQPARGWILRPAVPASARGALERRQFALAWRTVAHPFAALREESRLVRARPCPEIPGLIRRLQRLEREELARGEPAPAGRRTNDQCSAYSPSSKCRMRTSSRARFG